MNKSKIDKILDLRSLIKNVTPKNFTKDLQLSLQAIWHCEQTNSRISLENEKNLDFDGPDFTIVGKSLNEPLTYPKSRQHVLFSKDIFQWKVWEVNIAGGQRETTQKSFLGTRISILVLVSEKNWNSNLNIHYIAPHISPWVLPSRNPLLRVKSPKAYLLKVLQNDYIEVQTRLGSCLLKDQRVIFLGIFLWLNNC